MAKNISLCISTNEDYIDIELTSSPKTRDFSFQIPTCSNSKQNQATTTISADELFYNGKLLPLHHLLPRRQLLEITEKSLEKNHNYFTVPFITCSTAPCTNTTNTPLDISPTESRRASCELNPDEHFFQWSTELTQLNSFIKTKKSWSRKHKLIKHLKASKTYLKSLFSKSNESTQNTEIGATKKYLLKKKPFGQIGSAYPTTSSIMKNNDKEQGEIDDSNVQRISLSGMIKQHSPTKCLSNSSSGDSSSSSSSSLNSNNVNELQVLRRSSSATEIEGSIEAAIAHCKKSQKIFDFEDGERPGHCSSI